MKQYTTNVTQKRLVALQPLKPGYVESLQNVFGRYAEPVDARQKPCAP